MNEFIKQLLFCIAKITEVPAAEIVSTSRKEETVVARKLFVLFARHYGISTDTIAKILKITTAGVRNITKAINTQEKTKIFKIYCYQIKKELETNHAVPLLAKV